MRLYIGLLHYPVYDKNYQKIASAITNLDLHDLSRSAKSYGVNQFFVITPLEDQQIFAERLVTHWIKGYGARYNEDRKVAFELIRIMPTLDHAVGAIADMERESPILIATDASRHDSKNITYAETRGFLNSGKVVFLLFGTAWGLHQDILNRVDFILDSIQGNTDYNHLSVRTAAGIILDRLAGR
ncbi:MAG: RNA methyltransferase [Deltaproteobacteria bacterium]|nr:RNA methyltransferase [Deltaproteobacteria bacterium]